MSCLSVSSALQINIFRDPRWGRGRETPGEDPYLTSAYLHEMIHGLQEGEDARYVKVLATCKHYTAYDMEQSDGTDRFGFDALVSDQDLAETFQPPFQACVEAGVLSLMCSFNSLNGVPMCANAFEQNAVLRQQWGFTGYITSDCGGVDNIYGGHHWVQDDLHTVPAALHGGCDLDCGGAYQTWGVNASDQGLVSEQDVDQALGRAFTGLMRTGWFDPPQDQYYRQIGVEHIDTAAHRQLALESAEQSIVLLKNANRSLPLPAGSASKLRLAIIGPNANESVALWVSYYGIPPYAVTPLLGAQLYGVSQLTYSMGCGIDGNDTSGFADALSVAAAADVVLFVAGNSGDQENEGQDRDDLQLPGVQWQLLQQIEQASKAVIVLALLSSGPIDLTYARDSPRVSAILSCGVPGQSGGTALMRALYGDFSPAGRLSMTNYPAAYAQQIRITDMRMRGDGDRPGRTYKFYAGDAVFPFGFGLSYSRFRYHWEDSAAAGQPTLAVHELIAAAAASAPNAPLLSYRVNVTNVGSVAAADSVLGFISANVSASLAPTPPLRSLFSFDRVFLQPGETKQALLVVSLRSLLTVREDGSHWLLPGQYRIVAGVEQMADSGSLCERSLQLEGAAQLWSEGRKGAAEAYAQMREDAKQYGAQQQPTTMTE